MTADETLNELLVKLFKDIMEIEGKSLLTDEFKDLTMKEIDSFYPAGSEKKKVLVDIKGILDRKEFENAGYVYWRL